MDHKSSIDVEGMLKLSGDFGRQQLILVALFSVINLLSAFHYFSQTFISLPPETIICNVSEYEGRTELRADECSFSFVVNGSRVEKRCTLEEGWIYPNGSGFLSIVEQLNWVCDENWDASLGQSMFFVGSMIGSLCLGVLADRIGRLRVLIIANMLAFFGNFSTILTTNVGLFALSRFISGTATDCNFVMMYIIVMEYIRPEMRTFGLNICIGVFYCFSCVIVPWIAILLGNWRDFLIVVSVPHLCVLSYYFFVPESAQWLISKGRIEEAIECFRRVAKVNGKVIAEKEIEGLRNCYFEIPTNNKSSNFWSLLKTPKLRKKTLILVFKSMVMTLCYDAISRNVSVLEFSPFATFSITSVTIFPASILIVFAQDRVGRKALASSFLALSGVFSAISGALQAFYTASVPVLVLNFLARFAVTVAYNSGAQYAVELIPTAVRGQGVTAVHVAGYAASFFSPQVLYLKVFWPPIPDLILAGLLFAGAIACLALPETLGRTLPVTLEEGEAFGEDEHLFYFACCRRDRTESTLTLTVSTPPNYSF